MNLNRKQTLCTALLLLDEEGEVAKKKKQGEASGGNRDSKEGLN